MAFTNLNIDIFNTGNLQRVENTFNSLKNATLGDRYHQHAGSVTLSFNF